MDVLRVLFYARVSSQVQKRREGAAHDEPSLQHQFEVMETEASRRGWNIVHRCEDVETGSVPVKDRPDGRQIYELAEAGRFDVLMVYDNDRLGRDQDAVVAKVFRADLRFAGRQIYSIHQPVEPKRPEEYQPYEDDAALWLESVSDTASSVYIRQFRRRRDFGMRKRVQTKRLMPGKLPIGYLAVRHELPTGRVLLGDRYPDPDYAPIIRRIFDLYEAGASALRIAVELNADGLHTPRGYRWTAGTLHGILENPVYYGAVAYLKHRSAGPPDPRYPRRRLSVNEPKDRWMIVEDGRHEAIITKEQWERCQDLRRARSTAGRTMGESTLLSGMVECGHCGHSLNRSGANYWICQLARDTARRECNPAAIRVNELQAAVLAHLAKLAQDFAASGELELAAVQTQAPAERELLTNLDAMLHRLEERFRRALDAGQFESREGGMKNGSRRVCR